MVSDIIDTLRIVRSDLRKTNEILTDTYHNCIKTCGGRGECMYCPARDITPEPVKNECKIIEMFPMVKKK